MGLAYPSCMRLVRLSYWVYRKHVNVIELNDLLQLTGLKINLRVESAVELLGV